MADPCKYCGAPYREGAASCWNCRQPYPFIPAKPRQNTSRWLGRLWIAAGLALVGVCLCAGVVALVYFMRTGTGRSFAPPEAAAAIPTPRVLATKIQSVGPGGGTIVMDSGVRLVFPAGAVNQAMDVQVNQLDPAFYLDERSGGLLVSVTAPQSTFQKNIALHIPLPGWFSTKNADAVFAGVLDETSGEISVTPSTVQVTDGKPELVVQTNHFSNWFTKWWNENFAYPPTQAGPFEVPYYAQSRGLCWSAVLQMISETAQHSQTTEVFSIVGSIGSAADALKLAPWPMDMNVTEQGLPAGYARYSQILSGLLHGYTGAWPEREIWLNGTHDGLVSYIRRQLGIYGRPVGLFYQDHAITMVGYDGTDFYVHDPQGLPGQINYRASWEKLGLAQRGTENMVTIVIPQALASDRPLVTVNIKDFALEFTKPLTDTPANIYQFTWDLTRREGYRFSDRANQTAAPIPGQVTELRLVPPEGNIEIANSYLSGGSKDVVVHLDITGRGPAKTSYHDQATVRVDPGSTVRVKFKPIPVDAFRDPAPAATEYLFHVRALVGGKETDDAIFTFVIGPRTTTPTVTDTPVVTSTSTLTPTPNQSQGEWILQAIIPVPNQKSDSLCYFNNLVSLGDGSFTSSGSWKDEGCRAEGGPYYSGSITTTCSWTSPSSYLKVGSTLTSSMSCESTAQQTGGDRSSGGGGWIYLTVNPYANDLGGRFGWSDKLLGDVKAGGWSSTFPVSGSLTGSMQVPDGKKGDILVIVPNANGQGGSGKVIYKYIYGGTDPVPPRAQPAPPAAPNPITITPSPTPTLTPTATDTPSPESDLDQDLGNPPDVLSAGERQIFSINSNGAALNGAYTPAAFTITRPWLLTKLGTYHWNNGRGADPGTLSLRASDGTRYGPWQASGQPGSGGVTNAYWLVIPDALIPAGAYTVIDSDPGTWSQNDETSGRGMSWGFGIPR